MKSTNFELVVPAVVPHGLLFDKQKMSLLFENKLEAYMNLQKRRHARIPNERARVHIDCDPGHLSVNECYVVHEL